jgi:hypothetical protein
VATNDRHIHILDFQACAADAHVSEQPPPRVGAGLTLTLDMAVGKARGGATKTKANNAKLTGNAVAKYFAK